jgi:hypothetical protein
MHPILARVRAYLEKANRGEANISPTTLNNVAEAVTEVMTKHLNGGPRDKFTIRMSNIGRPFCQLWHEKHGTPAEENDYAFRMKMIMGDLIEIVAMAIMREAGVPVEQAQKRVTLDLAGVTVEGEADPKIRGSLDTIIYGDVWDIKSTSPGAFFNKFSSYKNLKEHDAFGYIGQGYGYSTADKRRLGGWIAVNKSTGEWGVVEAPLDQEAEKAEALAKMAKTVKDLNEDVPFRREFSDEPELFRKKPTGNRVLCETCSYCPFKWNCWPNLQHRLKIASEAKNRPYEYYTYVDPKFDEVKE